MKSPDQFCRVPPSGARVAFAPSQRGSVLIVGVVMLTLLTFMVLAAFRMGKSNLQIVGNSQQKAQNYAAAQGAIERVISSPQLNTTPAAAMPNPCNGVANTSCVDLNGDGVPDITVTVAPTCLSTQVVSNTVLDYSNAEDKSCTLGVNQDFGTTGASIGNSLCSNLLWDVAANVRDDATGGRFTANQGVAIRVAGTPGCP